MFSMIFGHLIFGENRVFQKYIFLVKIMNRPRQFFFLWKHLAMICYLKKNQPILRCFSMIFGHLIFGENRVFQKYIFLVKIMNRPRQFFFLWKHLAMICYLKKNQPILRCRYLSKIPPKLTSKKNLLFLKHPGGRNFEEF